MALLDCRVLRDTPDTPPSHHVVRKPRENQSVLQSLWPSATREKHTNSSSGPKTAASDNFTLQAFQNPWPSWHKPSKQEVWNALEWGEDQDPCIRLASQHQRANSERRDTSRVPAAIIASSLLKVQKPDFTFDQETQRYKLTWLGHAGILVQFAPLQSSGRPFRCLFDPMFSMRSSPHQSAGPLRSYPPPCKVGDLPEIDAVMISHDHYDHLDTDTILSIWKCHETTVRFIVPLRNAAWFASCGIPEERVVDLDWWDSLELGSSNLATIKITCTPSQHNSGRGSDPDNSTLWSSWYIAYPLSKPLRVFFGGDTGFQFHSSSTWPPSPDSKDDKQGKQNAADENGTWPICPAFGEIAQRLGSPNLLMLPIWVGATFDYLRSFSPLPNSVNPFPRHRPGLTAANHMPPWDAVRVLQLMTADLDQEEEGPVAVAIHWGTFMTDPVDILKTLGQLEYACQRHTVRFARSLEQDCPEQPVFLALDHGQSIAR